MNKIVIPLLLISSTSVFANAIHISPEMKIGPYAGSGISGAGMQLGLTDTFGLDAVYVSYSHTSAEFLGIDKDRLKTYRLGGQYQLVNKPKMSLQLEVGFVEYEGSREPIFAGQKRHLESQGASISASWLIAVSDNIAFRAGTDFNYINRDKTFLPYDLTATISTGVVFSF